MGFLIDQKKSRLPLIFSCVINIGLLVVFKYTDFIISSFNTITTAKNTYSPISSPVTGKIEAVRSGTFSEAIVCFSL